MTSEDAAPSPKIPVPRGPLPVIPPRSPRRTVELTIDGQNVAVPEGATLLDAARQLGIETPTLCFPRKPDAGQRLPHLRRRDRGRAHAGSGLLAQGRAGNEGEHRFRARAPLPPAGAGAAGLLRRSFDRARRSRATWSGTTRSRSASARRRLPPARASATPARPGHHHAPHAGQATTVGQPVKVDNDLYVRDYSKCIVCYKCVEACGRDAQNTFAIALAGRGFDARISTEFDVPLTDSACVYCGNCIGVCPTGALMFRSEFEMREAGTWEEPKQTATDTICPYCGVGCTLTVHVQDEKIVKVTSPIENEVTHGKPLHQGAVRLGMGESAGVNGLSFSRLRA